MLNVRGNDAMKNSLYATLLTGNPHDAGLVDAWLDERIASSASADLPSEITSTRQDNGRLANAVTANEYDGNIAPGQIRILSKRFTADPDVIPYVAVLEKRHEGMWLVAPFSQYSYPATPGEMTTGIRHVGLRVMQAWNARTIQDCLLAKSFFFGELPDDVRQECLELFRHETGGRDLPEGFKALRGCAIMIEGDPRKDYIDETISRLRPLSTAVKATERICAVKEAEDMGRAFAERIAKPRFIGEERKLAAGTRKPRTESYDVGEIALDLEYSPESEEVTMTFYDSDDETYLGYDGYGLLGANQEFLGTFRDGFIRVPAESVCDSFMLTDPDGEAVEVVERT